MRIPMYQAEKALLDSQVAMMPYMKPADRRRVIRTWQRVAGSARRTVFTDLKKFQNFLKEHGVGG